MSSSKHDIKPFSYTLALLPPIPNENMPHSTQVYEVATVHHVHSEIWRPCYKKLPTTYFRRGFELIDVGHRFFMY
ncbi:hypothetical protein CR513_18239, partial [Mucuna pruriens]